MMLIDFHFEGGGRSQAVSALQRLYPSYSVPRRLLKALNAFNQLSFRLPVQARGQLAVLQAQLPALSAGQTRSVLLHKIQQNHRAYVFDQDRTDALTTVTKVAFSDAASQGLHREAQALNLLAGRPDFRIPELLSYKTWEGGGMLEMSAIPDDFRIHDKRRPVPDALFEAILSLRGAESPVALPADQIGGWQSAQSRTRNPVIRRMAAGIQGDELFEVAAAHRDLGSENLLSRHPAVDASDFSLIDWEFYSETAPVLTDQVSLWLGRRHRAFKGRWKPAIGALTEAFITDFGDTRGGPRAAVLALLHLAAMGNDLACILVGEEK